MAFDLSSARDAGYSDEELVEFLSAGTGFDVDGAMESGYSTEEILSHLAELATRDDSDEESKFSESTDETPELDEVVSDDPSDAKQVPAEPEPDTGDDIPPRYFRKIKVDYAVFIEDERVYETTKVSAKDALASIKDDLENFKKLLNCMKG